MDESIIDDTTNAVTIMLNYEPTLSLHPPPRAIPAVVVRAHYALPGGLVIVVVVHQRCHRLPPPPSSPSRGWLLLGAACRHRHLRHCRPPPMQPHQRRRPRRFASSFSPPEIPLPPVAVAPSPPSRSPMAPSWTGMRRRRPPSRSDAASAAPARAPRRDTGPLLQCRRHDRLNASVSSPAASGRPSFASRAAVAGRATGTAARRR